MSDIVNSKKRSQMMSGIRNKNTGPEILIRKNLHSRGFRYRLHGNKLPGKPDIILPRYRAVIFVNGCFWHGHECHLFKWPQTRKTFWENKISDNKLRDKKNITALIKEDWRVAVVWECALRGKTRLELLDVISTIEQWIMYEVDSERVIKGK